MADGRGDIAHEAGVRRQEGVQPGLGAGVHKTKTSSWITVGLITLASIAYGFALPAQSLPLAIVGTVLLVIGLVLGFTGKIMEDAH